MTARNILATLALLGLIACQSPEVGRPIPADAGASDAGPAADTSDSGSGDAGSCAAVTPSAEDAGPWDQHPITITLELSIPTDAGSWQPLSPIPIGVTGFYPDASVGEPTEVTETASTANGVHQVTEVFEYGAGIDATSFALFGGLVARNPANMDAVVVTPNLSFGELLSDLGVAEFDVAALTVAIFQSPPPDAVYQPSLQATLLNGQTVTVLNPAMAPMPAGGTAGSDQLVPIVGMVVAPSSVLLSYAVFGDVGAVLPSSPQRLLTMGQAGSTTTWTSTFFAWRSALGTTAATAFAFGIWGTDADVQLAAAPKVNIGSVLTTLGACSSDVVWLGFEAVLTIDPTPTFAISWRAVLADGQVLSLGP